MIGEIGQHGSGFLKENIKIRGTDQSFLSQLLIVAFQFYLLKMTLDLAVIGERRA